MALLGLALPSHPASWTGLVGLARAAEALGWASVWLPDPGCAGAPAGPEGFDPITALAGLARVTTSIGLGTLALDAGLRPPGVLAKALATVDRLSGGRLTVGLAPPDDGVEGAAVLAEVLTVLRAAFAGDTVDHVGHFFRVDGLRVDPGPVQRPGPPLWVVGRSDPVLAVAAAAADGWNPGTWAGDPDGDRDDAARVDEACRVVGRDPAGLARSANWLAAAPAAAPGRVVARGDAAPVSSLICSLGALPFGETSTDDLQRVASATE